MSFVCYRGYLVLGREPWVSMHRGAVAQSVERPKGPILLQIYILTSIRASQSADIRYKYTRFRNVERKKSMHRYIWPLQDGDVTIHAEIC